MFYSICFLSLLIVADDDHNRDNRAARPCYIADVQVILNGTARHGQLLMTDDGIYLENLDDEARRWASTVLRHAITPSRGWNDRLDPIRSVWCSHGTYTVLAEVCMPAGAVILTSHRPLRSR